MPQAQKFPCLFPMLSLIKELLTVKSENIYMDSFEELKEIGKCHLCTLHYLLNDLVT